ncbi:site-specific recombinase XerD [Pseudomonas sp. 478]|uniref:tyrosine-type recombinase/integrase n=1 Tax=unclassified Pseudomonas TaxID=196821 RepID=UPI000DAC40CA|nr:MULTISPECIES: site-specific integrase [unclassified Pseudomonas]PZX01976.1 site-specific recombinase XerD [Pseudomonas sp. 478]TCV52093.1 site-specific recombinase XerD [Pseudomonas sp. 460]
MLLLWPSKETIAVVQGKIKTIMMEAALTSEKVSTSSYHIPIIFDEARGVVLRDFHDFLYEKSYYSNYYKSDKTVRTYAESLLNWLKFTSLNNVEWTCASSRNIALYRNSMKSGEAGYVKPLSAATVNLRLSVVYEFYKYYWTKLLGKEDADRSIYAHRLNQLGNHVRVKSVKKRPRALTQDSCQSLMQNLRGVHRVIFAWTLTTGLRVGSVLSITCAQIEYLKKSSSDGFIEVLAKGGKVQKAYVPRSLLIETFRYAEVIRVLSQKKVSPITDNEMVLFINGKGNPVTRTCYYAAYKRACKQLDIVSHPHQARTTFATYMERQLFKAAKNLSLDHVKIVQGLLGHSSSTTTQDYLESISGGHVEVLDILERYADTLGESNE